MYLDIHLTETKARREVVAGTTTTALKPTVPTVTPITTAAETTTTANMDAISTTEASAVDAATTTAAPAPLLHSTSPSQHHVNVSTSAAPNGLEQLTPETPRPVTRPAVWYLSAGASARAGAREYGLVFIEVNELEGHVYHEPECEHVTNVMASAKMTDARNAGYLPAWDCHGAKHK